MNIFTEKFKDIEDYYEAIDGVNIILTEKCNLRCQYCYQKEHDNANYSGAQSQSVVAHGRIGAEPFRVVEYILHRQAFVE